MPLFHGTFAEDFETYPYNTTDGGWKYMYSANFAKVTSSSDAGHVLSTDFGTSYFGATTYDTGSGFPAGVQATLIGVERLAFDFRVQRGTSDNGYVNPFYALFTATASTSIHQNAQDVQENFILRAQRADTSSPWYWYLNGGSTYSNFNTGIEMVPGTWYHIEFTWDPDPVPQVAVKVGAQTFSWTRPDAGAGVYLNFIDGRVDYPSTPIDYIKSEVDNLEIGYLYGTFDPEFVIAGSQLRTGRNFSPNGR